MFPVNEFLPQIKSYNKTLKKSSFRKKKPVLYFLPGDLLLVLQEDM